MPGWTLCTLSWWALTRAPFVAHGLVAPREGGLLLQKGHRGLAGPCATQRGAGRAEFSWGLLRAKKRRGADRVSATSSKFGEETSALERRPNNLGRPQQSRGPAALGAINDRRRGQGPGTGTFLKDSETVGELPTSVSLERRDLVVAAIGLVALVGLASTIGLHGGEVEIMEHLPSLNVGAILDSVSDRVDSLGSLGVVYFAAVYVAAEVLALPAVPLTASAGYLFGAVQGTAVVLVSATIAAGFSFLVGRTLLRGWVQGIAAESKQFAAIDRAVQREGFKIVLLLRLSPIFPFALSNYIYGLTAVEFGPYLLATLLGFAPGTFLYVYGGEFASVLNAGPDSDPTAFPWYFYAAFLAFGCGLAAKVTEIATAALDESGLDD